MCVCVRACVHACVGACMCVNKEQNYIICMYIYIYFYIYIYIAAQCHYHNVPHIFDI